MPTVLTRTVALRPDQWDWLLARGNVSRAVRDVVDEAMAREKAEAPKDSGPSRPEPDATTRSGATRT